MAKKERLLTPVGILVYPKLNEVDVYQPVDKKGRPSGAVKRRFITRIKFENQDDLAKVKAFLEAKAQELLPDVEHPKLPIKKDKKDGTLSIEATSGEKYQPILWDANNNKIPPVKAPAIGGGTKARLDVSVNAYDGFGGGINLYLNAVQIIELVESTFGKSNFETAEGGFTYDDDGEDDAEGFGDGAETAGTEKKGDYAF
jgi:hypothetical protein